MTPDKFRLRVRPERMTSWEEFEFDDVFDVVSIVGLMTLAHMGRVEMQVHKLVTVRDKLLTMSQLQELAQESLKMQGCTVKAFSPAKLSPKRST